MLKTYVYKYPYFSLRDNNNTYIQDFKRKKTSLKIINKQKRFTKNSIKKRELMLQKHKKKFDKTLKNKN
jgi:hypothetical protein